MLYNKQDDLAILQFEDEGGPVFRASFKRESLSGLLDNIHDALEKIDDEDKDEK